MTQCSCLLPPGLPDAALPAALTHLLICYRADQTSNVAVANDLAQAWNIPDALRPALVLIAQEADRSGVANSYHNPAHTRDVAINWANLAMLHAALPHGHAIQAALTPEDLALGLCAAFGHDLLHDGIGNVAQTPPREHMPFLLEQVSADHTSTLMQQSGLSVEHATAVATAIMTTEPKHGIAALDAAEHLGRREWHLVTLMLRDADVLPSIGLTAAEHDRQSMLLGVEFGADLNTPEAAETLFAQAAVERFQSPAGALFLPQFEALRALNRLRAATTGWLSLAATAQRVAGT